MLEIQRFLLEKGEKAAFTRLEPKHVVEQLKLEVEEVSDENSN